MGFDDFVLEMSILDLSSRNKIESIKLMSHQKNGKSSYLIVFFDRINQ
jgi:hypothetical protein